MTTAVSPIYRADLSEQTSLVPQKNFARVWAVSDEHKDALGDKAYALHIDDVIHMYAVNTRIGRGGAASVFLSTNTEGQVAALKKTIIEPGPGNQTLQHVNRELGILGKVCNREDPDDVAPTFAVYYKGGDKRVRAIYQGPLRDGDLLQLMRNRKTAVGSGALLNFFRQIAPILVRNHACGIINADLKLANLLYKGGKIYLHDYGNAAGLHATDKVESIPYIAAPELLRGQTLTAADELAPKVDMYNVGLAALGLLNLFVEQDRSEIDWVKVAEVIGNLPAAPQQIMNGLLEDDPEVRWSAAQLQEFLAQVPAGRGMRLPWEPQAPNQWRSDTLRALSAELELYREWWCEDDTPASEPVKPSRAPREGARPSATHKSQTFRQPPTRETRLDVLDPEQENLAPVQRRSVLPTVTGLLVGFMCFASGTVGAIILVTGLVLAVSISAAALVGLTAGFLTRYTLRALSS